MIRVSFSRAAQAVLALAASAVLPCVPWAQEVDFDREVKPIFQKSCSGCHFPESGALKAKLDLSTASGVLAGSANGAVIVPGKGGESPLIQMVEYKIEPHMPPEGKGAPLTPEAIDILRRWIDQGAKASPANAPPPAQEPASSGEPSAQTPSRPAPITALAYGPSATQPLLAQGSLHRVEVLSVDASGAAVPKFTLGGHAEMVRALAFSPDGSQLAAAGGKPGRGGEVKLWNVAEHRLVATLQGHRDNILGAAFSPDGQRLATCSYDKTIVVWDIASGTPALTLANHVDAVYAVAYSPDGKWIASGAGDRTVKLWDAASGALAATISDSLDSVLALAFSPSGDQLAGAGADKMIRIWDMKATEGPFQQSATTSGELLRSTFAHDGAVLKLAYSPDGTTLYSTSEDLRIKAWDTSTLQEKLTFEAQPDWVTAMAVSPDGAYLAAGRYDSSRTIYSAGTGQRIDGGATAQDASVASAAKPEPAATKKVSSLSVEAVIVEATVPPSVSSVAPVRWHRGTEVELIVDGKNLDRAEPIITTDKIVATLLSSEALPMPELKLGEGPRGLGADILDNARPFRLKLKLAIAPDAPAGRHEIMFRTPIGISNTASFDVLLAPDTPEAESGSDATEAQPLQWPGVVIGQIGEPGDVDRYRLSVKAGQDIVFAITDTALNPNLRLLDASGAVLVTNEGSTNQDSKVLGFRATADGELTLELADIDLRGGLGYRLHAGAFPLVTSVWPLGVPAGLPTKVQVKGFNLPGDTLEVDPPDQAPYGTAIPLPLPSVEGNPIAGVSLAVGAYPEALESEPNDSAGAAQAVQFPATLNGRIDLREAGQDEDLYRFPAAKGQTIAIEIQAARFGSPLDSRIEVLDASGNPLQRGVVRCLAETFLTLSPRDSRSGGLRLDSWRDLRVNDDVMIGGEIVRVFRLPDYADEDVSLRVFPNGQRMTYYGTTPEHHAVYSKAYKVEVHPVGTYFAPNGMPIFPIYWRNDDGFNANGDTQGDSRLEFVAPADGDYLVRVSDATGRGGEAYSYRLLLRPLEPDFQVFAGPARVNVARGGRVPIDVRVLRQDGFDGKMRVQFHELPPDIAIDPDVIPAGEDLVRLALTAGSGAQSSPVTARFRLTAESSVDGQIVTRESAIGPITVGEVPPDLTVSTDTSQLALAPGKSTALTVKLDRFNGFSSRVPIEVLNLPFGVRVMNTGLNGILVREGEKERTVELYAEPWVHDMDRTIYIQAQIETQSPLKPLFLGSPVKLAIVKAIAKN